MNTQCQCTAVPDHGIYDDPVLRYYDQLMCEGTMTGEDLLCDACRDNGHKAIPMRP